jgi:hypothetical protein
VTVITNDDGSSVIALKKKMILCYVTGVSQADDQTVEALRWVHLVLRDTRWHEICRDQTFNSASAALENLGRLTTLDLARNDLVFVAATRDGTKCIQNGVLATPKTYNILVILCMYVVFLYMYLRSAPVPITKKYSVRP